MSTWFSYAEICEGCKVWVTVYAEQELSFGHMPTCEHFSADKDNFRHMWAAELMESVEELGPDEEYTWEDALAAVDKHGHRAVDNVTLYLYA